MTKKFYRKCNQWNREDINEEQDRYVEAKECGCIWFSWRARKGKTMRNWLAQYTNRQIENKQKS